MRPSTWDTSDKPAEHGPDGDEHESQAKGKEAHHGITGRGLEADLASEAIGTLDAKAATVAPIDDVSRPVQIDDHEEHPFASPPSFFTWRQRGDNGNIGLGAVGKGIGGAIALPPLAELAGAACFAADGACQHRRLLLVL